MPKNLITEKDDTGSVQLSAISSTVYIPGKAESEAIKAKLFTNASALDAVEADYVEDLSFKLAHRLLALGMPVVFEGLADPETELVTEGFWEHLKSQTQFNLRFLTTGGYACPSSEMVSCAADRGDCIALLDHPLEIEDDPEAEDNSQVAKVRRFFEQFVGTSTINPDPDSFASAFTPWFETNVEDLIVDNEKVIPASFGYLLAYARSVKLNPTWYAVAGSFRGSIPELSGVTYEYSEAEVEMLQARAKTGMVPLGQGDEPFVEGDNIGKAINPIAFEGESFGYLIWGNRTFRENTEPKRTIATSFLNVRNLVCDIKKTLFTATNMFRFEPNNDILWMNFQSQVTPILERMVSGNGILGYKLIRQKTQAKGRLRAKVIIVPIEAVEDFEITVNLADSLTVSE